MADETRQTISDADAQRIVDIALRWADYHGDMIDSEVVLPGQTDENVVITNARTIIDTGVDFLFGQAEVVVQCTPESDADQAAAEERTDRIEEVLCENDKDVLLAELAMNGAVAGHAAIKFLPKLPGGEHRLLVVDPATHTVECDPHDYKRVLVHRLQYNSVDPVTRRIIIHREDHTRNVAESTGLDAGSWTITRYVGEIAAIQAQAGVNRQIVKWTEIGEPELWAFDWCQIHDCQNLLNPNVYWGLSDIEKPITHVNEAVNEVASDTRSTLRYFAHPTPVAIGSDPKVMQALLDVAIGQALCLPAGSEYSLVEMQHDLASSKAFQDDLDDKQFEMARIPKIAIGRLDNAGALTGVALRVLYRPLLAKTEMKRKLYGGMIRKLAAHILAYDAMGDDCECQCIWPDVLPRNEKEEADTAAVLSGLGVSRRTLLERMGFDPDLEEQRRAEEANDPMNDLHGGNQMMGDMQAQIDALTTGEPDAADAGTGSGDQPKG